MFRIPECAFRVAEHIALLAEWHYDGCVIGSFRDKNTEQLFRDGDVPRFRAFERVARRKLYYLNRARTLGDLRMPPGNRLEALRGDRAGQYSIRINDQWRICFVWTGTDADYVEIVDYH